MITKFDLSQQTQPKGGADSQLFFIDHSPMEKLRETVINLASANLKEPLSTSQLALIDQRLHESFPFGLRLLSHPTYASMVFKAIKELCEQGGSSEESISENIKANCDDLPWAHKSILRHHLNRLCDQGLIVLDSDRYSIPGFTPKPKKGKLKRKQIAFRKSKEFEALESGHGIEDDEPVKNGCQNMVVDQDKEAKKSEEAQQCEKSLITMPSIAETVKTRRILRQGKCDQLLTKSLVDDCEDNTRNEILALEDDINGNETPVMKKKKNAEKGGTREKSLVDECRDLEDDSNGTASFETFVKKKKNDELQRTGRLIVCGIAAKFPKPTTSQSERRVTRQSSKSKEQPKKLIKSLGKKIDNPPQPKKLIISPVKPLPSSTLQNRENPKEASKPTESEQQRRVTRQLSKSKEQQKTLMISPVNPDPSSKLQKHDNPQEPNPVNEVPSSELQNHENPQEPSNPDSQGVKSTWPSWVQSLLDTDFYGKCKVHADVEKRLCYFYCLDCTNGAFCPSCLTSHEGHNVIEIKKTEFEAGVDTSAMEKHIDVSGIHTHKGYGPETTIVLKYTIPHRFPMAANNFCRFCQRRLLYGFDFCTLSCKFQQEQRLVGSMPCKIK